jgi:hypothetical protein
MKITRRKRLDARTEAAAQTKQENKTRKAKAVVRRDKRMQERVRAGTLPYTPDVMSWLSVKLGKKASRIVPADVAQLIS